MNATAKAGVVNNADVAEINSVTANANDDVAENADVAKDAGVTKKNMTH
ncbi:MAG: hypothetical protein ACMX3H_15775 [Sodalis sp. (in: enterobacteria)]